MRFIEDMEYEQEDPEDYKTNKFFDFIDGIAAVGFMIILLVVNAISPKRKRDKKTN